MARGGLGRGPWVHCSLEFSRSSQTKCSVRITYWVEALMRTKIALSAFVSACIFASPASAQNLSSTAVKSSVANLPGCQPICGKFPSHGDVRRSSTHFENSLDNGMAALEQGHFGEAAQTLSHAALSKPDSALAQYLAGGAHYLNGDNESARRFLRRATRGHLALDNEYRQIALSILAEIRNS